MTAVKKLEERLAALEAEVAKIKQENGKKHQQDVPWWEKICGTFANDPLYDEAMRLGREYRESLRPKARKKKRRPGK